MFEYITAGGFLVIPILLCSVLAMAIVIALFIKLSSKKVVPEGVAEMAGKLALSGKMTPSHIAQIRDGSLLGRVLAAGLESVDQPRHVMKTNIEETGRHVIHEMDRYMTTLGTIAAIAPLLGLLGTVVGMISVFSVITSQGVGNPTELAGGISQALITTAAGISVAVPALIFHRYFRSKINGLAIDMEKSAMKLVDTVSSATASKRSAAAVASAAAPTSVGSQKAMAAIRAAKAKAAGGVA
ncbi:MotA/TolQ/ExbB proton channel family protein [Leucothrix arctica]|uniref:Biopolymer transporter ExbB n=1 Tax=Leucothrix arctica TaxID=1481894 RepID=A0A317CFZ5_9GAMM|nr:MotA/TolQ/ExbB proton channel family protein [Leucothrix arctica]PWQ95250.1 biopolymer transporter ExbB [Leucothrix arctica]